MTTCEKVREKIFQELRGNSANDKGYQEDYIWPCNEYIAFYQHLDAAERNCFYPVMEAMCNERLFIRELKDNRVEYRITKSGAERIHGKIG